MRAVYDYVVQQTRYVALEFGIHGFKPLPLRADLRARLRRLQRQGDAHRDDAEGARHPGDDRHRSHRACAATSRPSRRASRRSITPSPTCRRSNLYLDGTAEYTGSTELPAMDRGALALRSTRASRKLVHLPDAPAEATRRTRKIEATLGTDGTAQLDIKAETSGALAAEERQRYHAKGTRKERIGRDLASEFLGFELSGAAALEMNDLEDVEQPVTMHARGKASTFGRRDGSDFSIPVGPTGRLLASYASLSSRKQDIRMHVRSTLEDEVTVRMPPSFHVKNLPETMHQETPFGTFSISAESQGGKITIKSKVSFDRTRVTPAEYPGFRAFCEGVDRAFAQRLIVGAGK